MSQPVPDPSPGKTMEETGGRSRNLRRIFIILGLFVLSVSATAVEIYLQGVQNHAFKYNLIIFTLLNINILLLLTLALLVGRNLVKLYHERRHNILGSRFRTKLVVAFVVLILGPTILLFAVASGLITASIDNWFSLQIEQSLKDSLEVAQTHYQNAKADTLRAGEHISATIAAQELLNEGYEGPLQETLEKKLQEYGLGMLGVFTAQREKVMEVAATEVPVTHAREPKPEFLDAALHGSTATAILTTASGDFVRGAVPIYSSWNRKDVVGALVVTIYIPQGLVGKMGAISSAFEEYGQLQSYKLPIKASYVLTFLLITLAIIFVAIWYGLYLSKGITIPIQKLAEATEAVARGNLDYHIQVKANDEIGTLVDSFNRMTHDLKTGKTHLEEANLSLIQSNLELDQRRAYMETVMEHITTGVISLNNEGRINTINEAASQILDMDPLTTLHQDYLTVLRAPEMADVRNLIGLVRNGDSPRAEREAQVVTPNRTLSLHLIVSSLQDVQGQHLGTLVVFDDLTELIKAQKATAWQEVAKRIAHEIKNPLTPIQLSAQRLRKKYHEGAADITNVLDECTQTIIHQVDGLKTMVDEFSRFARLPAVQPVPCNLHQLIGDVTTLYRSAHRNVEILTTFDAALPVVNLDRDQIKRVFINLFENAVAAMNQQGRIWVTTRYNSAMGMVTIEVADEGTGIQPGDRDKLFLPYFSRRKSGKGLGLAIVNRIISEHSGHIRVRTNTPRGTTFVIELPTKAA